MTPKPTLTTRDRFTELLDATTQGLPLMRESQPHAVWSRCRFVLSDRFKPSTTALVVGHAGTVPPELFFRTGEVEVVEDGGYEEATVDTEDVDWTASWPPWTAAHPDPVLDPRDTDAIRPDAVEMAEQLGAEVWVPLHLDVRTMGLLSLGRRRDGREYGPRERLYLRWFARHLEMALANALRNRRRAAERRRLDRSIHTLALLLDVSRALSAAHQLRSVLELILEGAMETVSAQKASLALYEPKDKLLRIHLVKGLPDAALEEAINSGRHECRAFAPGEGIAGLVFRTREAVLVPDTRTDPRFKDVDRSYVDSLLCVPLEADGEPIGVLNVTNPRTDRRFDTSDQDHLLMLAGQAAGAINRARLYELASTDELTGLYVRRLILQRLRQEVRRYRRYGRPISVALLDLDHFKAVNDTHGHPAGDEVLRTIGEILEDRTRRELDIPGRYGGEEFLLIMPETSEEGAVVACERLRRAVEAEPVYYGEEEIRITVSIGVAGRDEGDESPMSLLRRADQALYEAKRRGRNRIVTATEMAGEDT